MLQNIGEIKQKINSIMVNTLHTVIIITYNQQDLIGRAIESILCQKEYIYEIVIADDCSTDKTWDKLIEYQKKYPDIIKPYRNSINLGIFGNIENTWTKTTGNIIWYLAGDDIYCNGLFKEANTLIENNQINLENDLFTLYFDYKTVAPSGKEKIFKNNLVKRYNPISLKIRQLICNRTIGFSKNVLKQFYPVAKDIGIHTDGLLDIQVQFFSKKSYYTPFIGSIYFTDIGIASRTKRESAIKSYLLSLEQLKSEIKNISKDDLNWLNYLQKQSEFKLNPSFINYKNYINYFFRIIIVYFGWYFLKREIYNITKDTVKYAIHKVI